MLIQALNDKGKESLQKHVSERLKMRRTNPKRFLYQNFFSEEVVSSDPYILQVKIKNVALKSALRFEDLKSRMLEALKKNGSSSQDYLISEEK